MLFVIGIYALRIVNFVADANGSETMFDYYVKRVWDDGVHFNDALMRSQRTSHLLARDKFCLSFAGIKFQALIIIVLFHFSIEHLPFFCCDSNAANGF